MLSLKLTGAVAVTVAYVFFLFGGLAKANDLLIQPACLNLEKKYCMYLRIRYK